MDEKKSISTIKHVRMIKLKKLDYKRLAGNFLIEKAMLCCYVKDASGEDEYPCFVGVCFERWYERQGRALQRKWSYPRRISEGSAAAPPRKGKS